MSRPRVSLIVAGTPREIRVSRKAAIVSGANFGGENFDILFVTSARFTMSERHLQANPQEGGLFAVRAGVRGTPAKRFGEITY